MNGTIQTFATVFGRTLSKGLVAISVIGVGMFLLFAWVIGPFVLLDAWWNGVSPMTAHFWLRESTPWDWPIYYWILVPLWWVFWGAFGYAFYVTATGKEASV